MSIVIRPAICLVFGMLCVVNTTHALDLDKAITLPDAPVTLPITEAKGWYLRGDISTSFKTLNRSHSFSTFSVGNSYRAGTVSGTSLDRCPGALGGTNCALTSSGKFTSYGLMANAYVDLATVAKFTPYVGAGIGATQVNWGEFNGTGSCIGGGCGGVADVNIKNSGLSQWRTTWALMTGVSYELSEKAKLDFGYRYSRTSSGKMFGYDSASTALGASGTQARDGGFDRHEVRVGLRIAAW